VGFLLVSGGFGFGQFVSKIVGRNSLLVSCFILFLVNIMWILAGEKKIPIFI